MRLLCKTPSEIGLDYVHAFHLGMGMDIGASCIMLLVRMGHFNSGSIPHRLDNAFAAFDKWCKEHKRTTSIRVFSQLKFDMGTGILSRVLHFSSE